MIRAIIFDYAGVITVGDPGLLWYRENIPDFDRRKPLFDELARQVDNGELTGAQFTHAVADASGVHADDIWPGIRGKTVLSEELLAYIAELKRQYRTGLLSNYAHEFLNEVVAEHGLYKYFDEIVISSLERVTKPDPHIYGIMLERLHCEAEEAVFIDDREENIDGAKRAGMKGLLYTSHSQLEKDLAEVLGRARQ